MGTISFMPWTTVHQPLKIAHFTLRPVVLDQRGNFECDASSAWTDPPTEVVEILNTYRTRPRMKKETKPNAGTLASATVVQFGDRPITDDLTDADIESLFTLREAITFSGLAQREFFAHRAYWNRDSFALVSQRFTGGGAKGVTIVSRRLDGSTHSYWPLEYVEFRREEHVQELRGYEPDGDLARAVFSKMTDDEQFALAVAHFNSANTDRPNENVASDLISLVSAYQQLFGATGGKCEALRSEFANLMARVPVRAGPPTRASLVAWLQRQKYQPCARDAWILDLCTSRGNVAHGHKPSAFKRAVWSLQEHLLLGSYLFPLLVKLRLSNEGTRALGPDEKRDLALFDEMCSSENLLAGIDKDGDGHEETHRWNEVRWDGRFKVDTDWN